MKLKIEDQDSKAILEVSESIAPHEPPILKAGLGKIFQTLRKTVLLDLTGLPEAEVRSARTLVQLIAIKTWAIGIDAELFIASPVEKLGDAPTREETLKLLDSPLGRLLALETTCKAHIEELKRQKAIQETRLASVDAAGRAMRDALTENSKLKKQIAHTERLLRTELKERREPIEDVPLAAKLCTIEKTLSSILAKSGVISDN